MNKKIDLTLNVQQYIMNITILFLKTVQFCQHCNLFIRTKYTLCFLLSYTFSVRVLASFIYFSLENVAREIAASKLNDSNHLFLVHMQLSMPTR